tara:strand:+ start:3044 stop:3373 length:330 start_codon:yes stop_codon:yes gene_type:complete
MSTHITKTWFVDGKIIEQVIPESEIYLQHWSIEDCKAYAVQLRDTTRANTAAHAADAIEYLLSQVQREWVGLTDARIKRIGNLDVDSNYFGLWYDFAKAIERELKEKNT